MIHMFHKPFVHTDHEGAHVIGKDGKKKMSFSKKDHGESHEGAAYLHLQQNYDKYMGEASERHYVKTANREHRVMKGDKVVKTFPYGDTQSGQTSPDQHAAAYAFAKKMNASMSEAKDSHEYGYEGEMALNQLAQMMHHIGELKSMLKPNTDLPEWVQLKITLAADYIQTAADYMNGEHMKEDTELQESGMKRLIGKYMDAGHDYETAIKKAKKELESMKIAKDVMKENKLLTGVLKKLEEGRGRPPKEGSAAWHRQQSEKNKPAEEPKALEMQLRKTVSIGAPVTFNDGKTHQVHDSHAQRFMDHMAARRTSQEKHEFQKRASASHDAFKKAVSEPLPSSKGGGSEIVKYRY
jgi:hypothetical protein